MELVRWRSWRWNWSSGGSGVVEERRWGWNWSVGGNGTVVEFEWRRSWSGLELELRFVELGLACCRVQRLIAVQRVEACCLRRMHIGCVRVRVESGLRLTSTFSWSLVVCGSVAANTG